MLRSTSPPSTEQSVEIGYLMSPALQTTDCRYKQSTDDPRPFSVMVLWWSLVWRFLVRHYVSPIWRSGLQMHANGFGCCWHFKMVLQVIERQLGVTRKYTHFVNPGPLASIPVAPTLYTLLTLACKCLPHHRLTCNAMHAALEREDAQLCLAQHLCVTVVLPSCRCGMLTACMVKRRMWSDQKHL